MYSKITKLEITHELHFSKKAWFTDWNSSLLIYAQVTFITIIDKVTQSQRPIKLDLRCRGQIHATSGSSWLKSILLLALRDCRWLMFVTFAFHSDVIIENKCPLDRSNLHCEHRSPFANMARTISGHQISATGKLQTWVIVDTHPEPLGLNVNYVNRSQNIIPTNYKVSKYEMEQK